MTLEYDEITAPSYWASALINGDRSELEAGEIVMIDAFLERCKEYDFVGIVEDSDRFTWHFRLYGGDAQGGNVCDYKVLREV